MTFHELERQITQGKISPAYFFPGEEEYLKGLAINKLATAFIGEAQLRNGLESISATEQDGTDIVQRTQSLGMFSDKRVIVVKETESLSVKSRKMILEYVGSPSPDVCMILCAFSLDKKTAFYKGLAETIPTIVFNPLKETETVKWIITIALNKGLEISPVEAQLLIDISGNNLGVLEKEIEKLDLYISNENRRKIKQEDIKSLAGASFEVESYELTNSICSKDLERSLDLYEKLLSSGEDPVRLVGAIYYQFEKLWKVALLANRGVSPREIGYKIQSHEYYVNQMIPVSKKRNGGQYLGAMKEIYQAELRLKSGQGEPKTSVQQLIYKLSS